MERRWIIKEEHFGRVEFKQELCSTYDLQNAAIVISAMLKKNEGRPIKYKAEKVVDSYIPVYDDLIIEDGFLGKFDYSKYLDWQYCIKKENE